jgi:hypothetical protein
MADPRQTPREPVPPPDAGELYVAYLPVPPEQMRFLRIAIPVILWALVAGALVIGRSQRNPGPAAWDNGTLRSFTGTVVAEPYPTLYLDEPPTRNAAAALLVQTGKHGSATRVGRFHGAHVRVAGWLLEREGRSMIELSPDDDAIQLDPSEPAAAAPDPVSLGRATLAGEIVDAKCYLGAMKPGNGKTHKECATLCITGGIPPMLVTRAPGGHSYYLLLNPDGGPLGPEAYPLIGEPVEISGDLESCAGVLRLRVDARDIRRR